MTSKGKSSCCIAAMVCIVIHCAAAVAAPEIGVGVGVPISNGAESRGPTFGVDLAFPLTPILGLRSLNSLQQYQHESSLTLDTQYLIAGIGPQVVHPAPWIGNRDIEIIAYAVPSLVFSRWKASGLNNSLMDIGISFGGGVRGWIAGRWGVAIDIRRYLSQGSTVVYYDLDPLDLPGIAATVVEFGIRARFGAKSDDTGDR